MIVLQIFDKNCRYLCVRDIAFGVCCPKAVLNTRPLEQKVTGMKAEQEERWEKLNTELEELQNRIGGGDQAASLMVENKSMFIEFQFLTTERFFARKKN